MTPAVWVTLTGFVSLMVGVYLFSPRAALVVFGFIATVIGLLVESLHDKDT